MLYLHYTPEAEYTPEAAQHELMEVLVKAGRRCAYDLRHAADYISDNKELRDMMYHRASHWIGVFNPGNDQKNYRQELHSIIENRERIIEKLKERCKEHGLDVSDLTDSDIPF